MKQINPKANLPEPAQEEVGLLIAELKLFTKVNVKDNALEWYK